jgi:predicted Zn-dependent protease
MKLQQFMLGLGCMLLSSCNLTVGGINVGAISNVGQSLSQVGTIDQPHELALGDDLAAMLLGAAPLHPDNALQHYVNAVGRYLASHSSRSDLPWTFGVLDTPDINAFAVPGGYVLVTSGLLANLTSEAELAAVLAHEIAHVTARHHLAQLERDNTLNLLSNLASAVKTYQDEQHADGRRSRFKNRQVTATVLSAGQNLYSKGLSRSDELTADAQAVQLSARAGYDPYAMAAVLQKLDSLQADSSSLRLLLASHPAPSERLTALEQQLSKLEQQTPAANLAKLQLTARYQQVLSGQQHH